MTIYKAPLFFFIVLLTLAGCAQQKTIFLTEGVIKNTSGSSFTVVPLNQNWISADVRKMRSQEKDLFFQALPPAFSSNTPNKVTVNNSSLKLSEPDFTKKTLVNEKLKLTVNIPPDTLLTNLDNRYIYFLEDYEFQLLQKAGERAGYANVRSESKLALQFETEFFLFDRRRSEVVAWGKVADEHEITGRPKFTDYLEVLNKVSRQILYESPFKVYEAEDL
ncbi:MAG: hypothetical protein JJ971_12145 [Balneolaceae bacterium]|nr:hypothetical protein [Balneolaceae bacterium]MBO6547398.1 hypothetical protein [Balneolaceae bacterium]MBO6647655.1 hypothetical protein [Balneolaceae bacterium]